MEAIEHHGNNLQRNDNEVAIDHLVNEIVNVPDGFTCFLCQVTNNTDSIGMTSWKILFLLVWRLNPIWMKT